MQTPYPSTRFGDRTGGQVTEQGKEDIVCMHAGLSVYTSPGKGHMGVGSWGELRVR